MKAKYLDKNINVRVSLDLYEHSANIAKSKSLGLSSYIRTLIEKAYERNISKKTPTKKGK